MLDRSVAPLAEAIQKPAFPDCKKHALVSGASLYTIRQGDQPVVMMELAVPISRDVDPEVTYFLCKMLSGGTRTRNAEEIAEALEYYGSHLEATPSFDYIFIRLYSLKRFFPIQLQLLQELLTDSTFPEDEFETNRSIRIQQLLQQQAKSSTVASQKFRESLFGAGHFYGKVVVPEVTRSLQIQSVKEYYLGGFRTIPTVFLTGDISGQEIELVEALIGKLNFTRTHEKPVLGGTKAETVTEHWKNAVQTSIRLGGQTINRAHKDIHVLKVANDLFGGFFGSRLMRNIREKKGLTYGISSSISHLESASYWTVSTDVLKEKADMAVEEIIKELRTLRETPPSQNELETVVNYSKGKFLMSFDSAFNSLSMIRGLILSGRDYSFWDRFLEKLDDVKPQEVSDILHSHFNPDKLTVVRIG